LVVFGTKRSSRFDRDLENPDRNNFRRDDEGHDDAGNDINFAVAQGQSSPAEMILRVES